MMFEQYIGARSAIRANVPSDVSQYYGTPLEGLYGNPKDVPVVWLTEAPADYTQWVYFLAPTLDAAAGTVDLLYWLNESNAALPWFLITGGQYIVAALGYVSWVASFLTSNEKVLGWWSLLHVVLDGGLIGLIWMELQNEMNQNQNLPSNMPSGTAFTMMGMHGGSLVLDVMAIANLLIGIEDDLLIQEPKGVDPSI